MSNAVYNKVWEDSVNIITDATRADTFLQSEKPQDEKPGIHSSVSEIYVKYILAVNMLNPCYDQIVQPQKRILIRKLLDGCLCRIIELKNDLVDFDISEFSYNDDVLLKLNVTPMDTEIVVPRYFLRENEDELRKRRTFIEATLTQLGYDEEKEFQIQLTEQEAILILQSHERARQGRLRGQFMKEIRQLKNKGKPDTKDKEDVSLVAASLIQRMWRGFVARRAIRKRKMDEMLLIGMIPQPSHQKNITLKVQQIEEHRHTVQKVHEDDYIKAMEEIEKSIQDKKGAVMMEEIGDEVRQWFKDYKNHTGKFPDFPSEESGGSRIMFSRQGTESEISKSTAISSKESKKSKDKDKKNKNNEGKAKDEVPEFLGYKCAPSNVLPEIIAANDEYEDIWKYKDESGNPYQKADYNMIYKEKHAKVESELRKVVDNLMRNELELLQAALDKDRAHKGKKAKKPQKKTRRGGKKSKKKREKDLTPDRTTESLFEELIANGIIKKHPEISIESFIGERSYSNFELLKQGKPPQACLGEIREIIKEYCILPLGSEHVHQTVPLVRSVLLSGPKGSGKKMLVHAICAEVGAVLFDLTPANIVGKYPGKTGLIMLIHLVNKVARLLQPAVIWMDNAEKPFVKKIPKTDKTDPKRLKKDLPKLIKGILPEDRLLFIGTSYCPWDADQKLLQQTYNKYIQVPKPDYGTLSFLWRDQLNQYSGISPFFETSSIAKLSEGYTVGAVLSVIKAVMTTKRILQLRVHPLTHLELIAELSRRDPIYLEEEELAEAWWWKTPLGRKKQRAIELEEEARKEAEEQLAKAK